MSSSVDWLTKEGLLNVTTPDLRDLTQPVKGYMAVYCSSFKCTRHAASSNRKGKLVYVGVKAHVDCPDCHSIVSTYVEFVTDRQAEQLRRRLDD